MRQNRGREQHVEQYRLQAQDGSGSVFRTIGVSAPELERHDAGYPVSGPGYPGSDLGDSAGVPLAGASDEQLIAELRRRLTGR
jgi:hypothetical protein